VFFYVLVALVALESYLVNSVNISVFGYIEKLPFSLIPASKIILYLYLLILSALNYVFLLKFLKKVSYFMLFYIHLLVVIEFPSVSSYKKCDTKIFAAFSFMSALETTNR